MKDNINPSHYKQGKVECIDAIESSMTKEEFEGYLKGNILKYTWRYKEKNGIEDLKKAQWYLEKMIRSHEEVKPAIEDYIHPSAVKPIAEISNWGGKL